MQNIKTAIVLLGAYKVSVPLYKQAQNFQANYVESGDNQKRVKELYNKEGGKWAIVTGGSEGIGYNFALDLAKSGMNILLVSRSIGKLQKAKDEILSQNPGIQVEIAAADLSNPQDYQVITKNDILASKLGVIVNNAGQLMYEDKFFDQDPQKLQTMQKLNLYAMTLLTKYARNAYVSQIRSSQNGQNKAKFGLIQLSSTVSDAWPPHMTLYSATKRFNEFYSISVQSIFDQKIYTQDIHQLIVKPGIVTTTMTSNLTMPIMSSMPQQCSGDSMNCLGVLKDTYGSKRHNFVHSSHEFTPTPLALSGKKLFGDIDNQKLVQPMRRFQKEKN